MHAPHTPCTLSASQAYARTPLSFPTPLLPHVVLHHHRTITSPTHLVVTPTLAQTNLSTITSASCARRTLARNGLHLFLSFLVLLTIPSSYVRLRSTQAPWISTSPVISPHPFLTPTILATPLKHPSDFRARITSSAPHIIQSRWLSPPDYLPSPIPIVPFRRQFIVAYC
ncbi:hypothetical protein PYCCODRAFT_662167 [Trametes coccinea BRFM310]|uniref:Uncharacterized protein n=1 Tax=Trametes coccinea (strain BRFM310) TaxID=1353009 RepID=A0A1Y2IJF9_TRAC3|nr:hypothetical protein PYCCODRAFT_662167 [Trametes coccinea BRFM310]